ncbi:AUGMIN subunit 5-like [Bidens hawaiensis]|uniref:AUGMIN subunit 5-like n=1 Tax=Bidens hawaiensis TaxID=980011 RepID=UPI00404A65E0
MHTTSNTHPEAIIDWLNKDVGYRPLGPHHASSNSSMPSSDGIRRVCRGNMVPVFEFLLTRVKSEKTVDNIRRNIIVHGREDNAGGGGGRKESRGGKKKGNPNAWEDNNNKETALHEREEAEKEVKRLRHIVRRKQKELKEKMVEVSCEENERKRVLDERSNYRHKQVMLEAYGTQCDVTASIFTQYHKHLLSYVNQATDSHSANTDSSVAAIRENNIRKACETLADQTIEKIHDSFPAYEGYCIHSNPHLEASKLCIDYDENVLDEVQDVILDCLKSPHQLLLAVTAYTQRLKSIIVKEIEKIDVRADAEMLRYKYENNKIIEASPDLASPLPFQLYGNGNNGHDTPSNGTRYQRLERQKAHVQQFMATEDQLNKAAGARSACQNLFKRLYANSQNMSSLRQLERYGLWREKLPD